MRWLLVVWGLAACGRIGFMPGEGEGDDDGDEDGARCDPSLTDDTIALYSFETTMTSDTTTQHDAAMVGTVAATPGPCGTAASFASSSHLVVPASTAFDLPEGSVELFARVVTAVSPVGQGFGPPGFQLWIDGDPATGTVLTNGTSESCTVPHTFGIAGNANTVVIGALNGLAPNGSPMPPISDPLTGAIDQIRIRSTWRDFGED